MQTLNGHFDGKVVVLDEPVDLEPNTRVKVIAPSADETEDALVRDFAAASEASFHAIWDNSLDADYDRL
jgi:hypothetical protein